MGEVPASLLRGSVSSPNPESEPRWAARIPQLWFGVTLGFLALGWAGFLLLDWLDVGGIRDGVLSTFTSAPLFFLWAFGEAGPIEIVQWLCLGFSALLCLRLARRLKSGSEPRVGRFFLLGAGAFLLMFLEDSVNIRHFLSLQVVVPLPQILHAAPDADDRASIATPMR